MITSWSDTTIANGFEAYRDILEQLLGYRFVFLGLPLQGEGTRRVLDYGCGPGKVALRLVQRGNVEVVAVDASPAMLTLAQEKRSHPSIYYRLVHDDTLDFVADDSLDGAMTCFVFINMASEVRIQKIVQEVFRTLKAGAPFFILDTNPSSTGIDFSGFRNGEPGKTYAYGGDRQEWLHVPGRPDLVLHDYHWPQSMYLTALRLAGFEDVEQYEPTLRDIPENELRAFEADYGPWTWKEEWTRPPFILFRAIKQ